VSAPAVQFLVALPVRNGGEYFKTCVLSILGQTYHAFRLVVFDNASIDGSITWLRELDNARVTIHESSTALLIEENWARIAQLPSSDEYLTMIGHDDVFDPTFLSSMAELITDFPEAGLYYSRFRLIDSSGRALRSAIPSPLTEHDTEFLAARLALRRDSFGTGYVMRLMDFLRVGGMPTYKKLMFADDALWLKLMAGSFKATLQRELLSYRVHAGSTSFAPDWHDTFDALHSYLILLVTQAQNDSGLRTVLMGGIKGYLVFWLRWAYFSVPRFERDPADFVPAIERLTDVISPLVGIQSGLLAREIGKRAIFGNAPWLRWMLWRARRRAAKGFLPTESAS
jgi:glycosyltransferase involved in cell wall biosynthesis